jgi:hypothetical protein
VSVQEARKANKLLGKVEEAAKRLSSNQITAEQLIESQVVNNEELTFVFSL